MAGGFLGLPGLFGTSPMGALGAMPPAESAPSPSPAPAPAPAPDPATTGAITGGGGAPAAPSRGFGDVLQDMMSGRGIMGAQPGDDKVDPNTGITGGQQRQMNMQSMMGLGLTLLAAGARQSDDSRAAILARAPALLDQSDKVNSFAKTRLEMANARLKERQVQQEEAAQRSWQGLFRTGSGSAAAAPSPGAAAAAAPVVGAPGAAPSLPAAPAPTDATADATAAPVTPSGVPAVQPTASGVQSQPAAGEHPLLAGISPGVRQLLAVMPAKEGMEKLYQLRKELDGAETLGNPFQDPHTGKWFVPKTKNGQQVGLQELGNSREFAGPAAIDPDTGRKNQSYMRDGQVVRTENLGDVKNPITVETGPDGREFQVRRDRAGGIQERSVVPEAREDPYQAARAKQYVEMEGDIRKGAQSGRRLSALLSDFQGAINNPDVAFGPLSNSINNAKALAKSLGVDVKGVEDAQLATKVTNQLALMVRDPNGQFGGMPGATSDRDVNFLLSSVPSLMATREGAQQIKDTFQAMADRGVKLDEMRRAYVRKHGKLDLGFEDEVAAYDEAQPVITKERRAAIEKAVAAGQSGGNTAPAPETPVVAPPDAAAAHLKANPGLRDAFDAKYGAGSAARILGK